MADLIPQFISQAGAYFQAISNIGADGTFSATSRTLVVMLSVFAAVLFLFRQFQIWAENHQDGGILGFLKAAWQTQFRVFPITFFMMTAGPICQSIATGVQAPVPGMIGQVVGAIVEAAQAELATTVTILEAHGPVREQAKLWNPGLFEDFDPKTAAENADAAKASVEDLKKAASARINDAITRGQELQKDPKTQAQGALMVSQGKQALRQIQRAADQAQLEKEFAQAPQSYGSIKEVFQGGLETILTKVTGAGGSWFTSMPFWKLVGGIKWLLGSGWGICILAVPLLFSIMLLVKTMEAAIGIFGEIARIVVVSVVALNFAAVVGPFALATLYSERWSRYGVAWLAAIVNIVGTLAVLLVMVGLAATGIGRMVPGLAGAGAALFTNIVTAKSYTGMFLAGFVGSSPLMLASFALPWHQALVGKSGQIASSVLNGGGWNP